MASANIPFDQTTGGLPLQSSTKTVPPGWNLKIASTYTFDQWRKDLKLWLLTTDLKHEQIGPAMALRLSGVPRAVADTLANTPSDVNSHEMASQLSHGKYYQDPATGS